MACLVHDSRYRALFHAVVNKLRNENRIPTSMLRNMPSKCCTCKDIDTLTLTSVLIHDSESLYSVILKDLIDQVNRDKQTNPKLVLALNRLENFIKVNRGPAPTASTTDVEMHETHSHSSESEDDTSMDDWRTRRLPKQNKPQKTPKPLKNGTFLFLPYKFEYKPATDVLLEHAKQLQRGRFFGRNQYISSLEKQHNVRINMITSTTSEQIKQTLKNAEAGTGNVKIHNKEDLSEENGEWILVRQKKSKDETNTTDIETILNELKNRWDGFLKIKKRKSEEDDDEHPSKKNGSS